MTFNDELTLFLKARYPILYISTVEEDRVEYVIRKTIKTNLNRSIYSWDFVDGYTNNPNNEGFGKRNPLQALELIERLNSETPALFILKDFNRFLTDLAISRKLRNISRVLKLQPKTIIIIGFELNIPKEAAYAYLKQTVFNLEKTTQALTGPFARNDQNTIEKNKQALQERQDVFADIYQAFIDLVQKSNLTKIRRDT